MDESWVAPEQQTREAATKRWRRLALAAGCVLLMAMWISQASRPGERPEGCPEGCATRAERAAGPLRVMSLNMLHDFPRFEYLQQRLALIAAAIRERDPDVVCLQEVPWTMATGSSARWLASETGLNYLYLRANGNRYVILFEEGEALLSRYPLRQVESAEVAPSAGVFEHRVVLRAVAVTPDGLLRVGCTHLTNGDPATNQAQIAWLARYAGHTDYEPIVIAGDFNASKSEIRTAAPNLTNSYRALNPESAGLTCCIDALAAGPDERLEQRIDYVLFQPGIGPAHLVSSQRVFTQPVWVDGGWLWASDHVGLLVEIEP